jgi:hypothetical protein
MGETVEMGPRQGPMRVHPHQVRSQHAEDVGVDCRLILANTYIPTYLHSMSESIPRCFVVDEVYRFCRLAVSGNKVHIEDQEAELTNDTRYHSKLSCEMPSFDNHPYPPCAALHRRLQHRQWKMALRLSIPSHQRQYHHHHHF